jgi:hypothetical protein
MLRNASLPRATRSPRSAAPDRHVVEQIAELRVRERLDTPAHVVLAQVLRSSAIICCVVRAHGVLERLEPTILEMNDPVGDVEDPGVVGDEQHRGALLARERLDPVHHLAARLFIEEAVGSSASRMRGSETSARAIATRWR